MQCLCSAVCARNRLSRAELFIDYSYEHVVFVPKTTCSVWCRVRRRCALDWWVDTCTDGWRLCAGIQVVLRVRAERLARVCADQNCSIAGACLRVLLVVGAGLRTLAQRTCGLIIPGGGDATHAERWLCVSKSGAPLPDCSAGRVRLADRGHGKPPPCLSLGWVCYAALKRWICFRRAARDFPNSFETMMSLELSRPNSPFVLFL
jgi:hypothetical protein